MKKLSILVAMLPPLAACGASSVLIPDCQVINTPGAYEVSNNLPGSGGLLATGNCLEIEASYISINLAGFVLTGDGSGDGVTDGFDTTEPKLGTAVLNGTITGFRDGVSLGGGESAIQAVRVANNQRAGIHVASNSVVSACQAIQNGRNGISVSGSDTIVTGSTSSGNGGNGINAGVGALVAKNVVINNGAAANGANGLAVNNFGIVKDNIVRDNAGEGISARRGSVVTGNIVSNNGFGASSPAVGINASNFGSVVSGNTVEDNAADGILAGPGANVSGNMVRNNGADGIEATCAAAIRENISTLNTGLNLRLLGAPGDCLTVDNLTP